MSHSFDAPNGTTFVYNPDLSGEVEILPPGNPPYVVDGPDLAAFIESVVVRWIEAKTREAAGE